MNEKHLSLLRKLNELAKRGIGGEKENAALMLDKYCKKYGIKLADLESETKHERSFQYTNVYELEFIIHLLRHVSIEEGSYNAVKKTVQCDLTNAEYVEAVSMWEFYRPILREGLSHYVMGFMHANKLFAHPDRKQDYSTLTPEEIVSIKKMQKLSAGIDRNIFRKQIGG